MSTGTQTRPARILSVSQHKTVLTTRNAVLRYAGYEVVTTMDLVEAESIAANDTLGFSAAVLGDSIPYARRVELAQRLKKILLGLPVVIVIKSHDPTPDRKIADAWLNALEGPEVLLEKLQSVVK